MRVDRGMVGLVPPEDRGILMADHENPYVHLYCRFSGSFASEMVSDVARNREQRFFYSPRFLEVAQILRRIGTVREQEQGHVFGRRELLLLEALLMLRAVGETGSAKRLTGESIREYLLEHLDEPTDLGAMARDFAVSKSTLCRRAKDDIGVSILSLHEMQKIEWASTLLRDTDLTIAHTAARVGYHDPFYFSRVFKKHTGVSPRSFRRQDTV
jgi:AraC-like DNA-binding protein